MSLSFFVCRVTNSILNLLFCISPQLAYQASPEILEIHFLLLDQIIKYMEPDGPDLSSLIQARDGMVTVVDTINKVRDACLLHVSSR